MKRTIDKLNEIKKNTDHPDGTYISVTLSKESQKDLDNWVTQAKISNPYDPSEYHSTVVYSRKGIPDAKSYDLKLPIDAKIKAWKHFDTTLGKSGKCLVGVIDSPELQKHHKTLVDKYGATHDFPEYSPHVTVSYDHDGDAPKDLPDFKLTYDKSEFKPLDLDYKPPTKK